MKDSGLANIPLQTLLLAFEQSPVTIVITDLEGNIAFVNPKFTKTTGYKSEEVLGKNPRILKSGSTTREEYETLWKTVLSGNTWKGVFRNRRKNHEVYWESAVIFPLRNQQGQITYLMAIKEDITEQKTAEAALNKSKRELELLNTQLEMAVGNANELAVQAVQAEYLIREREADLKEAQHLARIGSWRHDLTSGQSWWSDELFQILGRDPELGIPAWAEIRRGIFLEDRSNFIKVIHQSIRKGTDYQLEVRAIKPNGSLIWLLMTGGGKAGIQSEGISRISGAVQDITERKKTENISLALHEINSAVFHAHDLAGLFEKFHKILSQVIPSNNFYIALLSQGKNWLTFPYSRDERDIGDWPDISIAESNSLTVKVIQTRKPLILAGTQLAAHYQQGRDSQILGSTAKCWVGVPLLIRDTVIGVMALQDYTNAHAFSRQDVEFLELAATQIAFLIERKQSEDALRSSEERYRAVFNSTRDAIISLTDNGTIIKWNRGAEQIFGYSEIEILGKSIDMMLANGDSLSHGSQLSPSLFEDKKHLSGETFEMEGVRKDGEPFPIEISISEWYASDRRFYAAVIRDITERNKMREELIYQATRDELTGLVNRRQFQQLANEELSRSIRLNNTMSVALIDIDFFKHINDSHGHAAGDHLLKTFARICRENIRSIDQMGRLGGDEFALLMPETSILQAGLAVDRLRIAITRMQIIYEGKELRITVSCGVAELTETLDSYDVLLSQADQALYCAKEKGRNCVVRYDQIHN